MSGADALYLPARLRARASCLLPRHSVARTPLSGSPPRARSRRFLPRHAVLVPFASGRWGPLPPPSSLGRSFLAPSLLSPGAGARPSARGKGSFLAPSLLSPKTPPRASARGMLPPSSVRGQGRALRLAGRARSSVVTPQSRTEARALARGLTCRIFHDLNSGPAGLVSGRCTGQNDRHDHH
jgi:hypothetical protein